MAFFEREAMILSSLKHPNIVSIQDYFQEHGNYFLVMEYVKGDNLQRLLRKRGEPFNEKQVIEWTNTILDVLHYLHSHKPPVIYRDIKPSNIMLSTADGIKLVDFGIARPYAEQENTGLFRVVIRPQNNIGAEPTCVRIFMRWVQLCIICLLVKSH